MTLNLNHKLTKRSEHIVFSKAKILTELFGIFNSVVLIDLRNIEALISVILVIYDHPCDRKVSALLYRTQREDYHDHNENQGS